jgi:hypothetical protein
MIIRRIRQPTYLRYNLSNLKKSKQKVPAQIPSRDGFELLALDACALWSKNKRD